MPSLPVPGRKISNLPASGRPRINLKALLIIQVSILALVGGVHLVHGFQMESNATAVYSQALQAEREGQPEREADYLKTYLALNPESTTAHAKLALLLGKLAKTPAERNRAYRVMEDLLVRAPREQEVRRAIIALGMGMGRFSEAKYHLTLLREEEPKDAELALLMARCDRAIRELDQAVALYNEANVARPNEIDGFVELADLLRRDQKKTAKADETILQMLKLNPRSARARLAAARYYRAAGSFAEAQTHLGVLLNELPSDSLEGLPEKGAEAYLLAGDAWQALHNEAKAREVLETGGRRYPDDGRFERRLARMELATGHGDRADAHLKHSLDALPTQPQELWDLGNLLIDVGQLERVPAVIDHFARKEADPRAGCLQARLLMKKQAWGEARSRLEDLRAKRLPPEVALSTDLLLADCFEQLGNPDGQFTAARRALDIDPQSVPARLRLGAALWALGKLDQAITEYERLALRAPEHRDEQVRLMLARNRRLPAEARRWDDIERVLKALPEDKQKSTAGRLLRAEVLAAWALSLDGKERTDKLDQARRIADAERQRDPKALGPWMFLATLAESSGETTKVLPLLDAAEKEAGRRVEWQLARAGFWARSQAPDAGTHLQEIASSLDQFPEDAQGRLASGLAALFASLGEVADAERMCVRAAMRQPNDLNVRYFLLERAVDTNKAEEADRLVEEMKRIEGPGGPVTAYAEAVRQAAKAAAGDAGALAMARRFLAVAAAARPSWSRVPVLEANLFEREGRPDKALEKYREAIDRGERRLQVLQRTAQLLYEQGQGAEANALLRALPEEAAGSPLLAPLAGQLAILTAGPDTGLDRAGTQRALRLAQIAANREPKNYRAQMWLGHIAKLAGEPKRAVDAFRKARNLADAVPETWMALILFLADTKPVEARKEMAEAVRHIPKDQAPLALAPCYEALKQPAEAEAAYQAALAARPSDPRTLRSVALYFLRHNETAKAEPLWQKLTEPATQASPAFVAEARSGRALFIAQRGGQKALREALALVDENLKAGGGTVFDRRARALVLATRTFHRKDAIALLEETSADAATTPPDAQFILAQLYEADGNWPRASAQMLILLRGHGKSPVYVAYYIRRLLAHGEKDLAQLWLDRLKNLAADAPETVELEARLLRARGDEKRAVGLLLKLAGQKNIRRDALGRVLEEFGRNAEAEQAFRDYAASSKDPHTVLTLAVYLARHKKLDEALTLCEKAWQTCRPDAVARAALTAVRTGEGSEEQQRRVVDWVTAAIDKHPDRAPRMMEPLATFEEYRGRIAEAEELYRKVLRQEPDNAVAQNNLAFLLALQGGHEQEALELVNKAIGTEGPIPHFLDTRGVVYLRSHRADQAIKDLEQAIQVKASPARYFHLAQARLLAKDRTEAINALDEAGRKAEGTDTSLKEADLHPLERAAFRDLIAELQPKK